MASSASAISQKEYLKKYLSKNKKKKKKPKISSSTILIRSQIIDDDDDLGLKTMASIDDENFNLDYLGDEAPQVAGVIDERPPEVRSKEQYGDVRKWKDFEAGDASAKSMDSEQQEDYSSQSNKEKVQASHPKLFDSHKLHKSNAKFEDYSKKVNYDSDVSPPRKSSNSEENHKRSRRPVETKGNRRYSSNESDSDISPPRNSKHMKRSKKTEDSDNEVQRKNDADGKKYRKAENDKKTLKYVKSERNSDSDLSPPRTRETPASRMIKNSLRYKDNSRKSGHGRQNEDSRRKRRDTDDDLSPPRKSYREDSPGSRRYRRSRSPSYKKNYKEPGSSRRHDKDRESERSCSPSSRSKRTDSDTSKSRDKYTKDFDKKSSNKSRGGSKSPDHTKNKKMEKTLDGKRAGLQKASNLSEEIHLLKENEERMFKEISTNLSGEGVAPIMRDRKTGKKRDFEKEKEEHRRKAAKIAERNSKYQKWGKGLKQVEEAERKVSDTLHEMTKPLARYANDEDLENFLKAQEREGDPMLDYFRQNQVESINCGVSGKPKYKGSFMPNRFGIPPGHRWDGVDRSSGYENQWFETRNAKKAVAEEAYKWSTSDM